MNESVAALALAILAGSAHAETVAREPRAIAVTREYRAMGTALGIELDAPSRQAGLDASDAAYAAIRADELRLSTWQPDSELSRANRAPVGAPIPLSPRLASDLRAARACAERTGHAFTPWIGPLVRAWGLRAGGRVPSPAEKLAAFRASQGDAFAFTPAGLVRRLPDAAVEEGGFGKGIALDDALAALRARGIADARLDFGGQLAVLGAKGAAVAIASPADRGQALLSFDAVFPQGQGSIATSSNSEHPFRHLLDPRTGAPAPFGGSVTIVAATGLEADCTTKIFVRGPRAGLRWADRHGVAALFVSPAPGGKWLARASCAWKPALHPLSNAVRVVRSRRGCPHP